MLVRLNNFSEYISIIDLFQCIIVRSGAAFFSAAFIVFACGPKIIRLLSVYQGEKGQPIRITDLSIHSNKIGTPTMGGIMILIGMTVSSLLWADWSSPYVSIILLLTITFGFIGFCDDYLKVTIEDQGGLSWKIRIAAEVLVAAIAVCAILLVSKPTLFNSGMSTAISFPFLKDFIWDIGIFFIPFGALVIVSSANAVNLTDGLDGLAIVPVMIASAAFALIAYVAGNSVLAQDLHIHFIPEVRELIVVISAFIGAGLGFLWFNASPAAIFMGDTGALALGSMLGGIAVATKQEIIMIIIGGLFVVETLSVIVQVFYFKITGQRIFLMAPLHHHFEKKGWTESQIVIRFWIIALMLAIVGILTLKIH
ncbi:MAG: phospho-N-acetylmuramoyl-pentapeptide-transferase [Candidatus Liberibacter ctenarytainae]|uniref:Phospho-N-acetylmuramoyl-pentapeptide-transferase n=1 Tax=Candidatus Liberibacter ctenarytainae TaxID=2020335 RepID=A0A937AEQ0_9HYPH|nr:phospho-N-acetylmuramoyl-pentapeptide-transferase [Candidatus Liberibacter ctenarytainae]